MSAGRLLLAAALLVVANEGAAQFVESFWRALKHGQDGVAVSARGRQGRCFLGRGGGTRPSAADRLANPDALLTRGDLVELGLERRPVEAVFRALPVVVLPGYSRPMVRVEDYRDLLERHTFRGDRVRPG